MGIPELKTGMVARYDSFASGLVPCKVIAISGTSGAASSAQLVTFKVTRDYRNYKRGEVIRDIWALHVAPVACVRRRKYSTVLLPYTLIADSPEAQS